MSRRTVGRGAAELVIVIIGVIIALAVDRWVASIDDEARAREYVERLAEDLRADSVGLSDTLDRWAQMDAGGTRFLEIVEGADHEVGDPAVFVQTVEFLTWWVAYAPNRGTWDEMNSTGQLGLIQDRETRSALTRYYSILDVFAQVQSRWAPAFQELWTRQQGAVPPLVVMSGMDAMLGRANDRAPTMEDAMRLIEAFRADPALLGAFGRGVMIYRYAPMMANQVRAAGNTALRLIQE